MLLTVFLYTWGVLCSVKKQKQGIIFVRVNDVIILYLLLLFNRVDVKKFHFDVKNLILLLDNL